MGGLSVFTCIRNSGNSPNKTDHRSMPQSLPTTESESRKILRFENGRHVKNR